MLLPAGDQSARLRAAGVSSGSGQVHALATCVVKCLTAREAAQSMEMARQAVEADQDGTTVLDIQHGNAGAVRELLSSSTFPHPR